MSTGDSLLAAILVAAGVALLAVAASPDGGTAQLFADAGLEIDQPIAAGVGAGTLILAFFHGLLAVKAMAQKRWAPIVRAVLAVPEFALALRLLWTVFQEPPSVILFGLLVIAAWSIFVFFVALQPSTRAWFRGETA